MSSYENACGNATKDQEVALRRLLSMAETLLPDGRVARLRQEAACIQTLIDQANRGALRVVFLGMSGVGKSAIISSLTGDHEATLPPAHNQRQAEEAVEQCQEEDRFGVRSVLIGDTRFLLVEAPWDELEDHCDPAVENLISSAYATVLVLTGEPIAPELAVFERIAPIFKGSETIVFVNKLDAFRYRFGPDAPLVEARIREKMAPYITDPETDILYGAAATRSNDVMTPNPVINLRERIAEPNKTKRQDAGITAMDILHERISSSTRAIRDDCVRSFGALYAGRHLTRPVNRESLIALGMQISAIIGIESAPDSLSETINGVEHKVIPSLVKKRPWSSLLDRIVETFRFSTAGMKERRYAYQIGVAEALLQIYSQSFSWSESELQDLSRRCRLALPTYPAPSLRP